jgi:HPt (histidine-containing phosphotransfer) domain-containing protein
MLNRNEPSQSPAGSGAAANAGGAPTVLDAEALDKLRALDPDGRADILLRVLGTYEGSLKRLMAQFDSARSTQDLPVLRHVAHTLRSSSASIGALELSRRCLDVELRIREGRTADLSGALEAMALESERAAAAVRAMLDRPGSPA